MFVPVILFPPILSVFVTCPYSVFHLSKQEERKDLSLEHTNVTIVFVTERQVQYLNYAVLYISRIAKVARCVLYHQRFCIIPFHRFLAPRVAEEFIARMPLAAL